MAVTQARTDEAWYVIRGKADIAVLDTGIDALHEDLLGKILPGGQNFADDNNDINDLVHHGTHVMNSALPLPPGTVKYCRINLAMKEALL